ncbi:hypothetical protein LCGC14_0208730 [marine sediment metagenome]|uniref:Uncharacterized protein n=1 Tax=marine sediment metagenome TaxID=412755 RepID=A0A0F9UY08_9ZZZZ
MGISLFSNKKGIKKAEQAAGAIQHTAIASMEAVDRERARGIAGEQAKAAVFGLLGSDPNAFTSEFTNTKNVDDPTSLFDTSGVGLSQPNQALYKFGPTDPGKKQLLGTAREGILDPEAYAAAISKTASFRIQSQRVRESEELLNQEGPAWDMLSNSVLGVINEGSALQLRDTMRKLKNQYAKGGTARRTAMFEANELIAGERAMRTRVQETWQANLALYDSVRQNADRVAAGTATFMAGLPLVNDSYRDAMQRTAQLQIMASQQAQSAIAESYDIRMTQQPVDFLTNFLEGTVKLVASVAGTALDSYLGGGAGAGVGVGGAGGGGTSAGGALVNMFSGRENAGYTPRSGASYGYRGGGANDFGGSLMNLAGTSLKAGLEYMNSYRDPDESDSWSIDRG